MTNKLTLCLTLGEMICKANLYSMKHKRTLIGMMILIILSSCSSKVNRVNNSPEWTSLFNGKDLDGWTAKVHKYEAGVNYAETFRAEDDMIRVVYDKYDGLFEDRFAHLYTDEAYSNFHLSLDYRFVGEMYPGTPSYARLNSGIMYHSQDPKTMLKDQDWPISVEMQFLAGIEEGVARPTGNMCSPGTHIFMDGTLDIRHCINSSSDTYYGDQWVHAELIVYGDSLVQHLINGDIVLEYSKPQIGGGVANRYDPTYKIDGTPLTAGHIALQAEGHPIDFKNIKIKKL